MKEKDQWMKIKRAGGSAGKKNELIIASPFGPPKWEVELWNKNGEKVKEWNDLGGGDPSRALIILKFDSHSTRTKYFEDEAGKIEYRFSNLHPTSQELEELETKALTNYLIDHASGVLEDSFEDLGDLKCKMVKDGAEIRLGIEKKTGGLTSSVKGPDIKIKGEFFITSKVSVSEVVETKNEKQKPWWKRTGWIIFFIVLAIILVLIAFFWKRIWKWLKGGNKQEKKAKEQIDIF